MGDEVGFYELIDKFFAQTVDVHLSPSDEPFNAFAELGGALWIDAIDFRAVLLDLAPAGGTLGGGVKGFGLFISLLGYDSHDLGDDFSGFFHHDGVAEADVLAADFFDVVEGGVTDGGSGEEDGIHGGAGGEGAAFADLPGDFPDDGFALFGGIFEGDAPAGGFAGGAEGILMGEGVGADDHAIYAVVEIVAGKGKFFDGLNGCLNG